MVLRMVDITEISAMVAAAGVLIGVVYYVLEMRQQTIIRKTGLMVTMYSWIQSKEYQEALREVFNSQFKDYEDYVKKYGSWTSEAPIHRAIISVCSPIEMVGTMLYRKQIDILFVHDLWGTRTLKMLYEKVKPIILGLRREFDEPSLMLGFEYLQDELVKKEPQLRKTYRKYMSQRSLNN
jgi:hypothetical protein